MEFPEQYTRRGERTLHSGEKTKVFYDVNELLTNPEYSLQVINSVPEASHYIGIATGGALIAFGASLSRLKPFSMIKDGELKGMMPDSDDWTLIDDVTTRETSLNEALQIVGREPKAIFVVMDRRKDKHLKLEAMFRE